MQCLALIPGTSRSRDATIIGGMVFGFSRRCATEFSFYLGIPTLMGAGAYSVWKERDALHAADLPMFAVGSRWWRSSAPCCASAGSSATCPATTSRSFAWYRIVFGGLVLLTCGWTWAGSAGAPPEDQVPHAVAQLQAAGSNLVSGR
jgi:undecaprenyl-diphosphatase